MTGIVGGSQRAKAIKQVGTSKSNFAKAMGSNKMWQGIGRAGGIIGSVFIFDNQMKTHGDWGRAVKNTGVHVAIGKGGAVTGAKIGAMLGSAVPLIGTVIGGAIGAAAGIIIGDFVGKNTMNLKQIELIKKPRMNHERQ